MSNSTDSPARIPESVRAIVNLYGETLADVRFPDIDRDRLHAAVAEVEQRSADLQHALATVQAARAELEASQAELHDLARRAHAYARVFAEGDELLSEQVATIQLDEQVLAPKRKRGRPRKRDLSQTSLVVAEAEDAA
jgi:ABC-type transporter Mla subunit MlaD